MTEAPEIIYLQWTGIVGHEDNTWCSDEISEDDVEYIKKALADKRLELLRKFDKEMKYMEELGIIFPMSLDDLWTKVVSELAKELE